MKTLLGWLCDPYLHVIVIGLVLMRMALAASGEEPASQARRQVYCERCLDVHEEGSGGCQIAAVMNQLIPSGR